jgi:hypothetical protein
VDVLKREAGMLVRDWSFGNQTGIEDCRKLAVSAGLQ